MSTCNQYKYLVRSYFTSKVQSLWNLVCILHLRQISIWTSHISSAHEPHVAPGSPIGQHSSRGFSAFVLSLSFLSVCLSIHMSAACVSKSLCLPCHPNCSSTVCSSVCASLRILLPIPSLPRLHLYQPGSLLLSRGTFVNFALRLHVIPAV